MGKLQGVHHAAFVMWEPEKTVRFYRDVLGFPIIHCITAKGWGQEGHADFVHIFFDAGGGNVIAFFHYFGETAREQRSKDYIDNGRHTALRASSRAELEAWRDKLKASSHRSTSPIRTVIRSRSPPTCVSSTAATGATPSSPWRHSSPQ